MSGDLVVGLDDLIVGLAILLPPLFGYAAWLMADWKRTAADWKRTAGGVARLDQRTFDFDKQVAKIEASIQVRQHAYEVEHRRILGRLAAIEKELESPQPPKPKRLISLEGDPRWPTT